MIATQMHSWASEFNFGLANYKNKSKTLFELLHVHTNSFYTEVTLLAKIIITF